MKRKICGIALSLAAFLTAAVPAFAAGTIHNQTFPNGREAYVYIPEGGAADKPVVFAFHGHNGSNNWIGDVETDFAKGTFISTNKLHELWPEAVVVYPKGLKTPGKINDQGGNSSGWQYMPGQYGESDGVSDQTGIIGDRDVVFLDDMLRYVRDELKASRERTYLGGFSNGAGFTYVAWAMRGAEFAAFAPFSTIADEAIPSLIPRPALLGGGSLDVMVTPEMQGLMREGVAAINGVTGVAEVRKVDTASTLDAGDGAGVATHTIYKSDAMPLETFYYPRGHAQDDVTNQLMIAFYKKIDQLILDGKGPDTVKVSAIADSGDWARSSAPDWAEAAGMAMPFWDGSLPILQKGSGVYSMSLPEAGLTLGGLKIQGGASYTIAGGPLRIDTANARVIPDDAKNNWIGGPQGNSIVDLKEFANDLVLNSPGVVVLLDTGDGNSIKGATHNSMALPPTPGRPAVADNPNTPNVNETLPAHSDPILYESTLHPGHVRIQKGTLALADGFALTGDGGTVWVDSSTGLQGVTGFPQLMGAAVLDIRGKAALNNMSLRVLRSNTLKFSAQNSSLTVNGAEHSYIPQGNAMQVDLNRDKKLPALVMTGGGALTLNRATLRLTGASAGTWLLVDGAYSGAFDKVQFDADGFSGELIYEDGSISVKVSD